ncbi:MAG TPA: ATP-binding protein [Polyangiaceae bacterium]|nr:ATP-binding protein [Polyangiaceae bacterium]
MFSPLALLAAMFVYIASLFMVARYAERSGRGRRFANHPFTYALGLSVYCTTWTYYGSVGKAATGGMGYLPVYLGPTLALLVGGSLFRRIASLKHTHRLTSIADFISARFAKSKAVAAAVTGILTVGIIPYIALQLKAANQTFTMLVVGGSGEHSILAHSFGPVSVCLMIVFTIVFGIRHLDPTERHPGMVASIAVEAFVKLVAFVAAGAFVLGAAFHGYSGFEAALSRMQPGALPLMGQSSGNDTLTYVTVMMLSMAAFAFLPRQFHVGVVENNRPDDVRTAQWATPLYLVLINLFVVPIALGGQLLAKSGTSADFYVLALPLQAGHAGLSLAVFLGGFSAAIGMVMIESMTMATMISNHLLLPLVQRFEGLLGLRRYVLFMRWAAAAFFILGGYLFAVKIGTSYPLVSIGLISFAAAFVLAPVVLLGLYWRGANKAGAVLGVTAGGLVWFYTLMVPTFVKAGWVEKTLLTDGPLGFALLRPEALFGWTGLPGLAHGVMWSTFATLLGIVGGSAVFRANKEELLLTDAFLGNPQEQLAHLDATNRDIDIAEQVEAVRPLITPYFSALETERLIQSALHRVGAVGRDQMTTAEYADFVCEIERLLSGAFGAACAHDMVKALERFDRKDNASVQRELASTLAGLNMTPGELEDHIEQQRERERVLEQEVEERDEELVARTKELQTLLDHVSFGLLSVDRDLVVQPGCSQSCHQLLDSEAIVGRNLADILRLGPLLRGQYEQAAEQLFDARAPEQVALDQMPKRFQSVSGRALRIEPRVVRNEAGAAVELLLTISDVTELDAASRDIETTRALLAIARQKPAFEAFLEQTKEQLRLARKRAATDAGLVRRVIHTVRGNAALYGLTSIARTIREIEEQPQVDAADLDAIAEALREFVTTHASSIGVSYEKKAAPSFALSADQLEQLRTALRSAHPGELDGIDKLLREIESVSVRELLGPIDDLVASLGERFGKKVALELHGAELRVDRARIAPVLNTLPQMLRNAIDHGIEVPDARGTKPDVGRLSVEILETETSYVVAVQDDGKGIDRAAVLRAAVMRGVVSEANARMVNEADALKLVLRERVSTAATVTDISGRGYGLSNVQAEAKRLGGDVVIHSRVGRGTRLEVTVPKLSRQTRRPSQPPARAETTQFRPSQRA